MDKIIGLLEQWQLFLDEGNEADYARFGNWLQTKGDTGRLPVAEEGVPQNILMTFGHHFGNLVSYADAWERLTFRDLPINGFHDFDLLNRVKKEQNPTKKELARQSTLEQSTVFESIKRLQKKDLLRDEIDKKDKRVRRVFLTEAGDNVIREVYTKAAKMGVLMVGDLTPEEIVQMTGLLEKLNLFHERLFYSTTKEEVKERYDL